jgi:hypothetical protein
MDGITAFERAWALACGLAEEDGGIGSSATEGLRGVRSVRRWLAVQRHRTTLSTSFSLLSNQVRYGGIGAYSTFLESLHLADMTALSLRPLGEALADAFPPPAAHGLPAMRDEVRVPVDALAAWGREAHAGALSTEEGRCLRDGLRGGEEAEFDDRTRWGMLRLLRACADADIDESALLSACLARLHDGTDAALVGEVGRRIRLALQAIEPYEHFYQCALFLFDRMRAAATDRGQVLVEAVATGEMALARAARDMSAAAVKLLSELDSTSDHGDLGTASRTLAAAGLVDLARTLAASAGDPLVACQEVLRRHARVQEGKFDGGLPKGPWIRLEGEARPTARLTAQRFGIQPNRAAEVWEDVVRHPYRTYGARRFIRQCRIA